MMWENPPLARFLRRLASFSRLIVFDKRGTGLSDRTGELPTLEQRMDDVRAVMDAVGSTRAALFGHSEGAAMCVVCGTSSPAGPRLRHGLSFNERGTHALKGVPGEWRPFEVRGA